MADSARTILRKLQRSILSAGGMLVFFLLLFVNVLQLTAFGVLFNKGLDRIEHHFDARRP